MAFRRSRRARERGLAFLSREQSSENPIPRQVAGIDIRKLPIGPTEAFVYSQIDGRSSDAEIALLTGLPATDVVALLRTLARLGAVAYESSSTSTQSGIAQARPAPSTNPAGQSGTHPRPEVRSQAPEPSAPLYDRTELEEPADLEHDRKHLILTTYYQLATSNHYELLKVPTTADKKEVKRAYYDVVTVFHPDRYYGKSLGSFKAKLEVIFQRLTEAHDTLARAKSREEYDRYLESQRVTAGDLSTPEDAAAEAARIQAEIERQAMVPLEYAATIPPPPITEASDRESAPPSGRISSNPPLGDSFQERRTPTPEDRRRALARKLSAGAPGGRPSSSGVKVPAQAATDAFRDRYERRRAVLRDEQIGRFVKQAEEALTAGNKVAAVNALRIAVSLAPDDPELSARFQALDKDTSGMLSDQYLEQARYEERSHEFGAAAVAYERALRGRPSAPIYERAAHCLLEARGDARKAVDLARKAVELAPAVLGAHVTLGRAYARAGLAQSALGELERARTLAPDDESVKEWIKRIKRGEV